MGNKWKKYRDNKQGVSKSTKEHQSLLKKSWQIFLGVAAILGLFATLYAINPKIIVAPIERMEANNPLSTLFSVLNDGLLPIYSVKFDCATNDIENETNHRVAGFVLSFPNTDRAKLSPGDSATIKCGIGDFGPKLRKAEIELIISFRPAYWPFKITRYFPFAGINSKDGKLFWFPKDKAI